MPGYQTYTDFELEMINQLKLLKGKLGHVPSPQEVDKEPRMQKSDVYKKHFGSWLRVQELVRNCSAVYDDPEDEAEEYVRRIEQEVPGMPKNISALAPGLNEAIDEIEAENRKRDDAVPSDTWKHAPKTPVPEKKPEKPAEKPRVILEKMPEKPAEKPAGKPAEKPKAILEKMPEPPELPKPEAPKVESPKPEPTKTKPEVSASEALRNEPKATSKKPELELVNLLGRDAFLSYRDEPVRYVPYAAKLAVEFCHWRRFPSSTRFDKTTCEREFGGVQVREKILKIENPRDKDMFYPHDALPDWKKGVYYLVRKEMAEEIRKTGRTTEDLLFPTVFCEDELEGAIYIHQLEVISS